MNHTISVTAEDLVRMVDEILERIGDDDAIRLLHQANPPLPGLGLGEFHTGAETLHGVAWRGVATTFPQPVGMGAMWDPELLTEMGDAVSTELRAMHAADPAGVSLNCWAPVVNPLRHPLWGRNEEGFSEDPHHTAACGTAYARGLRGDHPTFWKSVPTLKHLVAYNNETDRCTSSSSLPPRVLHEYDLPPFLGPVRDRAVGAVMASYNLVNGRPAHTSQELYSALREEAPDLLAVSDAYAPTNLTGAERAFATATESHAAAVRAGLDSFTDRDQDPTHTITSIREALDTGLLDMSHVRAAARRVLLARALTGEFTPEADPWAGVPSDAVDLPEHRALARRAAAAQVVLLSNDGLLPLDPAVSLAIVGPLATSAKHDWYSGTPPYLVSLAGAAAECHDVVTHDGADRVVLRSTTTGLPLVRAADSALVADENRAGSGATIAVTDWGRGSFTIADEATSLLWRGTPEGMVRVDSTRPGGWVAHEVFGRHVHDDGTWSLFHRGSRRWLRVESWGGLVSATADDLAAAERFSVEVLELGIDAVARVAAAADIVLVAVGNDPHINGRETEDRPELSLPVPQSVLWEAAHTANPDAMLVVSSSYPYALGAIADEARAVVWSCHAGQEHGHGLMDVLDGRTEPCGRLSQTWWAQEDDAGDLFDYDIIGARMTWWYNTAEPLYAFGHGLTYGDIAYESMTLSADPATGETHALVQLTNRGTRVAHELVQVYACSPDERIGKRLIGHHRAPVAPGESVDVAIPLHLDRLCLWDAHQGRFEHPDTTWRFVAAPSAAQQGPHIQLTTRPSVPEIPHSLPLTAWNAPEWSDVVGVAVGTLTGTAWRPRRRGGIINWPHTTPLPETLTIRVLAEKGHVGTVTITAGGASTIAEPDPSEAGKWHDVRIKCPSPGATDLELRIDGLVAVAEIRDADAPHQES